MPSPAGVRNDERGGGPSRTEGELVFVCAYNGVVADLFSGLLEGDDEVVDAIVRRVLLCLSSMYALPGSRVA